MPQIKNILNYYQKEYDTLKEFSDKLLNLKKEIEINKDDNNYNQKYKELYQYFLHYFKDLKELNLILPKKYLQNIINDDNYVTLFYFILQIKIFYEFNICTDKNANNFYQIFKYIEDLNEQLLNDKLERYEKISILMNLKITIQIL